MSKLSSYNGSIELISGIKPKNNGDFTLAEAHDIQVREDGTRLDEVLDEIEQKLSSGVVIGDGSSFVTEEDIDNMVDKGSSE